MNITIICVGKIKEKYFKDAIKEYIKSLGRYCKLQIIEVPDEKAPESLSNRQKEMVIKSEGEHIKKHLKEKAFKIALCIEGKIMSSEELSLTINNLTKQEISNIIFIIGGSLGLSDEVTSKCEMKLSFSRMTFPHQLMRVALLEQIYRSYKIGLK